MEKRAARDITFDITRSLCVLWIVAFWHIGDYIDYHRSEMEFRLGVTITTGVLACFTFMSGYFLSKYKISTLRDAVDFYKKRVSRFYVLLFISASSLFFAGLVVGQQFYTTKQYFSIITGLGCFIEQVPPTLWYFSMIMFFYILTPLFQRFDQTITKTVFFSALFALLLLLNKVLNVVIDERIFLYFIFYFLGLVLNKRIVENFKNRNCLYLLLLFICLFYNQTKFNGMAYEYLQSGIIIILLIAISNLIKETAVSQLFSQVSYASMCAYLFHRQFYLAAVFLVSLNNKGVSLRDVTIPFWMALISIIIIFISSFYLQKLYDEIIKYFSNCQLKKEIA